LSSSCSWRFVRYLEALQRWHYFTLDRRVKLYDAAPSEAATYAASHAEAFSKEATASPTTNETTATNATPHDEASSKAATTPPIVNEAATTLAMSSGHSHIQNQYIEDTVTNDTAISSSEITATKGKYHKHYDGNQSATKTTHQSWNVNARISCYAMYHQRKAVHNMEPILSTKHWCNYTKMEKHPEITAYLASQVYQDTTAVHAL
jgi:hypothetical protein